ncbi:hypothetical protein PSY47_23620, partial [Shigella flexneri]|nr:hypothetical protein [Shigella flexneri]
MHFQKMLQQFPHKTKAIPFKCSTARSNYYDSTTSKQLQKQQQQNQRNKQNEGQKLGRNHIKE